MDITSYKTEFEKAINFLKNDIASLRTSRATTALVEDLPVEIYGVKQPMKAAGAISVLDPKTVAIEPWDKSLLANIEKAIIGSSLGINPVNNGKSILLTLPELTQERRQELVKVLRQKLENARIAIRKIRDSAKSQIVKAEADKEIGEDDRYRLQDELDKLAKDYNDKIKKLGEDKEKEINLV